MFLQPNTWLYYSYNFTPCGILCTAFKIICVLLLEWWYIFVRIMNSRTDISDKLSVLWFFWSFFSSAKRSFLNHQVRIVNSEIIEISWSLHHVILVHRGRGSLRISWQLSWSEQGVLIFARWNFWDEVRIWKIRERLFIFAPFTILAEFPEIFRVLTVTGV